ncbi:MAG: hypothetical protein KKG09_02360 [Verrucomicrobia bacterium]|nr:hypothetical protein [Verrucomicrobiota bacterium]MCG2679052.1 hypothetical protein [Kiritimatiellia bacterium]MBU4247578.1 hypothetical protein [Verrucomicrobiota bacterium]MBU4291192.1 hypothetical protein [Verrucomicrobiota bacterium]MBU4428465.1 hypothetical protein [Verrucomicrobiota bacterium]
MSAQMRAILESKRAMRRQLRALPLSEKIALLEKLRDRSLAIANSPLRRRFAAKKEKS